MHRANYFRPRSSEGETLAASPADCRAACSGARCFFAKTPLPVRLPYQNCDDKTSVRSPCVNPCVNLCGPMARNPYMPPCSESEFYAPEYLSNPCCMVSSARDGLEATPSQQLDVALPHAFIMKPFHECLLCRRDVCVVAHCVHIAIHDRCKSQRPKSKEHIPSRQ